MILPKEINSRHKIRDAKIVQSFLEGKQQNIIAQEIGLTHQRVNQILYENRNLLLGDAKYEKAKRINYYKSQVKNEDGTLKESSKDPADLIDNIRKEYEGDSQVNVVTQFLTITAPETASTPNRLNALQSHS